MANMVIVGSKVRELVKKKKMNMAKDFLPALNKAVEDLVKEKCDVAKAFKKKTVSKQTFGKMK